ncbi:MAG: hypothetical protein JKY43_03855 [Phycisphaerales bacterium]|nr:hypothetical protein [Phycisphaerales bacterium]
MKFSECAFLASIVLTNGAALASPATSDVRQVSADSGAVGLVPLPVFEEVFWEELFGFQYNPGQNGLFVKWNSSAGQYQLIPLVLEDNEFIYGDTGEYFPSVELHDPIQEMSESNLQFEIDGVVYNFNVHASISIIAAELIGTTGESWYINGIRLDFQYYYTYLDEWYSYSQIMPIDSHPSIESAVAEASSYFTPSFLPFIDKVEDCSEILKQCLENQNIHFRLRKSEIGVPWAGIGTGAAVGGGTAAGAGALIGTISGPPGSGVLALIGGGLGTLFGAPIGGVVQYVTELKQVKRRYLAASDGCKLCVDQCFEDGEWPTYCDDLLTPPTQP